MSGKAQLLLVLGLGILLGGLSLDMSRWTRSANNNSSYYYNALTSHNLALAGAQVGITEVMADTGWYSSISGAENVSGGTYTVSRTKDAPLLVQCVSTYTTMVEVMHDTIQVYLAPMAFTSFTLYSWLTNSEGQCQWLSGDSVMGRLHSNGTINVNGTPAFMDKVTTARNFSPAPGRGSDKAFFAKGYETGVDSVYFPTDLSSVFDSATTPRGRFYNTSSLWVTLNGGSPSVAGDGVALIRTTQSGPVLDTVHIGASGFNGVIMGSDTVHVQGTVDGQVTVASDSGDIYVENDLLYERDPRFVTTSTDMLGLVAKGSVVVADNLANESDCNIQGNIFALSGSFTAQNYATGAVRGRLSVLGSIVQNNRGAVGTNTNGVLTTGYHKSYTYDSRLFNPAVRPPVYPGFIPQSLMIVGWWESLRAPRYSSYE